MKQVSLRLFEQEKETRVPRILVLVSDLLLSRLVGHFNVGETFSTARRVGHTRDLQQAFPLHGRDEGSCRVPRSSAHLECESKTPGESPLKMIEENN